MDLVIQALTKKYATFTGRARRKEFWLYTLVIMIVSVILSIIDGALGLADSVAPGLGLISLIFTLLVFIPGLAISIRRLHDTDRSGWWVLLAFIPIIGSLVLLFFLVTKGTEGENRFGADPLAGEE